MNNMNEKVFCYDASTGTACTTAVHKLANIQWWKQMISITLDGGSITWADENITYQVKDGKMIAPNKKSYNLLMKNTNGNFMRNYVHRASK